MSRSLLEQLEQVRGTRDFVSNMRHAYAEQCGREYSSGTYTVVSGTATIGNATAFTGDEVGNFIVIDEGVSAGVYKITDVSGTDATVTPVPTASDAAAAGRRHIFQNLEDDLNYIRKMMTMVIGENTWNDTPNTNLKNMAYLIPGYPNHLGETTNVNRSGAVTFTLTDIDQTGKVSQGAPADEYLCGTAAPVASGTTTTFTDTSASTVTVAGGIFPADQGIIEISIGGNGTQGSGEVLATLDLATAWTADGCVYEATEVNVGDNPNHTSAGTGTDRINLTNRKCMNVQTDGFSAFWPAYQMASVSANIVLTAGHISNLRISHYYTEDGSAVTKSVTYGTSPFWVDTTDQTITASVPSVTVGTPVLKYLSGVPYYSTNSTFDVSVNNSSTLFDRGYVTNPVTFNLSEFNAANNSPSLASMSLTEPLAITGTLGTQGIVATVGASAFRDMDARCTATYRNVFTSSTSANSAAGTYRIDTYGTTSTDTVESFDDEDKRMAGTENFNSVTLAHADNTFNSTTSIAGAQQLETYNGTLVYPTVNHSTFLPAGPNYSTETGDKKYYRMFIAGGAFTNGVITFSGWANALSTIQGAGVTVKCRMPNCSDYGNGNTSVWQDLQVDQTTYAANGCLGAGSTGSNVAFSFGTTSSSSFGNRMIIEVTFHNSAVTPLTGITFTPTL